MKTDDDAAAFVKTMMSWMDSKQKHLNNRTRKEVLEQMTIDRFDKIRRAERARARMKDVTLLAAVLSIIGAALGLLGINISW